MIKATIRQRVEEERTRPTSAGSGNKVQDYTVASFTSTLDLHLECGVAMET